MSTAPAPTSAVPGFEHLPGHHCGSTALRDLLGFHGAAVSEELAFGLGAGPCFYYFDVEGLSPSRFINGRTARLEDEFLALTGAPLRLRTAPDPEASWALAAETVDEGRPAILLTDLYYLDHYGDSAHFPGHAVVLAGYDDESAWVADTGFEGLQPTSRERLKQARHGSEIYYPLSGQMIDLPAGAELDRDALVAAAPEAIARAAAKMVEPEIVPHEGLPAMERFAGDVGSWVELPDWQWCARFNYQVIERRGTGGGSFRAMYARFLEEVGNEGAPLAAAAAEVWTALAERLFEASELDEPEPEAWEAVSAAAVEVLLAERMLWESLAG